MANFNRVILLGNLTRDPQLRYLPNNTAVCEFGLAVNRRWRDADGNMREETCFVDVSAFGRQAETINQYMSKGRPILIEGRLKFDSWTAQDGSRRSKLSVVAERFQFVGARGEPAPQAATPAPDPAAPPPAASVEPPPAEAPPPVSDADEIPF